MRVETLEQLLDSNPGELTNLEFAGVWDFLSVRNKILETQPRLRDLGLERIRAVVGMLQVRFPFDYRAACEDPARQSQVLQAAFGNDGDPSPTPFIPGVLLTLAIDGEGKVGTEAELTMMEWYARAALAKIAMNGALGAACATFVNDVCRVLREHGQYELAEKIAEAGVSEARRCLSRPFTALVDVYEALYDARAACRDRDASVSNSKRLAVAKEMLTFIDSELAPAIRARNASVSSSTDPEIRRLVAESEIGIRHRLLTWETAASISSSGWPTDATQKWLTIAKEYKSVNSAINAANALSAAIDELTFLVAKGAPHQEELGRLLDGFLADLKDAPWSSEAHRRDLLRRVTVAELALGRSPNADILADIRASLDIDLKRGDQVFSAFTLSSADDYLGLHLRAVGPAHDDFKSLFAMLRGAPLPPPLNVGNAGALRVFVTRFGSAIQLMNQSGGLVIGEDAHDLAQTLSDVAARVKMDIEHCEQNNVLPASSDEWSRLLRRLEGRVGLSKLARTHAAPRRVVLELDGLAVHVPIAGPLLDLWSNLDAVALTRLGLDCRPASLPTAPSVRVLCGFTRNESWDLVLNRVAGRLHASVERFATVNELRNLLANPASLVVLGAHGLQDGVAGELQVKIGPKLVPVEEAFADLCLPEGAAVVCAICYASSGQGLAGRGWNSLPECLLRAGARAVVANRWPAWDETETKEDFLTFLGALRDASVNASPWAVPIETTRFMKELRVRYQNPRQWAGWGAWIPPVTLECS